MRQHSISGSRWQSDLCPIRQSLRYRRCDDTVGLVGATQAEGIEEGGFLDLCPDFRKQHTAGDSIVAQVENEEWYPARVMAVGIDAATAASVVV